MTLLVFRYIVCLKLAYYKFDAAAGIDSVNRPIEWQSYPGMIIGS